MKDDAPIPVRMVRAMSDDGLRLALKDAAAHDRDATRLLQEAFDRGWGLSDLPPGNFRTTGTLKAPPDGLNLR